MAMSKQKDQLRMSYLLYQFDYGQAKGPKRMSILLYQFEYGDALGPKRMSILQSYCFIPIILEGCLVVRLPFS